MTSVKNRVKQFLKAFDLFSQPITFRYNDQPQYQTVTGGICSIILVIIFVAIFTGTTINTFNKVYIQSTLQYSQDVDPTHYVMGTDTFMFAVSVAGINMNQGNRWFDIYMQLRDYDNKNGIKLKSYIEMEKCKKDVWTNIDPKLGEVYDRLGFDQWICPLQGTKMQLRGKFTSEYFKFYKFAVKQCDPALDPSRPCVNSSVIQSYLDKQQAFNFNFYYVNMIINPGSNKYLSYYLDDLNYFPFSRASGVNANLFLSTFRVQTDQSIYPFADYNNKTGGIVLSTAQMLNYEVRQDQYMKFYLRKSSLSILVTRSFRKVDDTLSYIGGLFSAILGVLILMTLYNQFAYELEIARNLYRYDKDQPLDSQGFNFFVYLGYLIYMICDKFSISLPWKRMQIYHHSLEQVRKQMDIKLIMKKIIYSQRMALALLDEHKSKILHLQQPLTLQQAQQIRKDHNFYQLLEQSYLKLPVQGQKQSKQQSQIQKYQKKNKDITQIDLNMSQQVTDPSPVKIKRHITKQTQNINVTNNKKIFPLNYSLNDEIQHEQQQQQINFSYMEASLEDEQQLKRRIAKMKQYLKILEAEAQANDAVSRRILDRCDVHMTTKFIGDAPTNSKSQQMQIGNAFSMNMSQYDKITMKSSNKNRIQRKINADPKQIKQTEQNIARHIPYDNYVYVNDDKYGSVDVSGVGISVIDDNTGNNEQLKIEQSNEQLYNSLAQNSTPIKQKQIKYDKKVKPSNNKKGPGYKIQEA